jgi:hypothetical protein
MSCSTFISAIANDKEREAFLENIAKMRKLPVFEDDPMLYAFALNNNLCHTAIKTSPGVFLEILGEINTSTAFVGNKQALRNVLAAGNTPFIPALTKYGRTFFTALEKEKETSYQGNNKEFTRVLGRAKPGKAKKTTCRELVENLIRKLPHQQQPPQPPQQLE